jgi:hypothetical protein
VGKDALILNIFMKNKKRAVYVWRLMAILGIALAATYWYVGHRPLAYHNKELRAALASASHVEITLAPLLGPDGLFLESKPPLRITDRAEMDRLLRAFALPWHARSSGLFHECGGNVVITIHRADSTTQTIRFDHGKMFYPIQEADQYPGYCPLSDDDRTFLVEYFLAKGYSQKELGMSQDR